MCAIGPSTKSVGLRFLFGVLLVDPLRVLRKGTSVLTTWDFAPGAAVDFEAVSDYVREAVTRYREFRANGGQILTVARAQGPAARRG